MQSNKDNFLNKIIDLKTIFLFSMNTEDPVDTKGKLKLLHLDM